MNQIPPENSTNTDQQNNNQESHQIMASNNFGQGTQNQAIPNQYYGNYNGVQGQSIQDGRQEYSGQPRPGGVSSILTNLPSSGGQENSSNMVISGNREPNNQVMFSGIGQQQMMEPSSAGPGQPGTQTGTGESCKICYGAECDAAFIPCGHNFACVSCAQRCECCPVCRIPFEDIIKIYKQ